MIVTITPNPAIDITYTLETLTIGETQRVPMARARAGGKGINVARVAHQLGYAVLAIAPVGGDAGREFASELEASAVPHSLLSVTAATRRSIALVDIGSGQTTVLNETGNELQGQDWKALTDTMRVHAQSARCLVGSGSLPPGAPEDFYATLVEIAHDSGIPALIDATGAALLAAAHAGADVLGPNRRELAEATGVGDPIAGAVRLLDAGARLILVSSGEDGMFAMTAADRAPLFARLPHPLAGNPTGAGDAAIAAAAICLDRGERDTTTILRRATALSAAAVLSPVAGEVAGDPERLEEALIVSPSPVLPLRPNSSGAVAFKTTQ